MPAIVVALDFSTGSAVALRTAAGHAERTGAALHLFHADILFDGSDSSDLKAHEDRLMSFAAETLGEERSDSLAPTPGVAQGYAAAPPILGYAGRVEADLIVCGTHGRRGLRRLILGSVADELLRQAPCPVLVVPEVPGTDGEALPGPGAPIVAPVDFSALNEKALVMAGAWAATYEAPLHLVHIVEVAGPYPAFYPDALVPGLSIGTEADMQAMALEHKLEERAEKALYDLADRFRKEGVTDVDLFVGYGHPDRRIDEHALEHAAGLIVMATQGLSGVAHVLLGSVTERTVRRAPCAVLTVRGA